VFKKIDLPLSFGDFASYDEIEWKEFRSINFNDQTNDMPRRELLHQTLKKFEKFFESDSNAITGKYI
jgi:hypothetical protein